MNWYLDVLKNYFGFSGRARRAEYWYFVLFNMIVGAMLAGIDWVTGTLDPETGVGLLGSVYTLAILIPSIAVVIHRLHDTNCSGWWLLILFIPLIGAIALLIFLVQDSTAGDNDYGANPKGIKNVG